MLRLRCAMRSNAARVADTFDIFGSDRDGIAVDEREVEDADRFAGMRIN